MNKLSGVPGLKRAVEADDDKLRVEAPSFSAMTDAKIRNPGQMRPSRKFMHMAPAPTEASKPVAQFLQSAGKFSKPGRKIEGIN